jgi:hypothetical protein
MIHFLIGKYNSNADGKAKKPTLSMLFAMLLKHQQFNVALVNNHARLLPETQQTKQ